MSELLFLFSFNIFTEIEMLYLCTVHAIKRWSIFFLCYAYGEQALV